MTTNEPFTAWKRETGEGKPILGVMDIHREELHLHFSRKGEIDQGY